MTDSTSVITQRSAPRQQARSTDFISSNVIVPDERAGKHGARLTVRLTNYRSLPLSCINGVDLSIDGTAVDPADVVLIINGNTYPLPSVRERHEVSWFVLDSAEIYFPLPTPLKPGSSHEVVGALRFVSPSQSGGRTVQTGTARVRVRVPDSTKGYFH